MILPNKLIPFKDSIISKIVYILDLLRTADESAGSLFAKTSHNFEDVNEFILALDVLFALEKIEIDEELKVIRYVKANHL